MNVFQRIRYLFSKYILKKVTVLDILEYGDKHRDAGLCQTFNLACIHYHVSYPIFRAKCKEFNFTKANTHFKATGISYWWPSYNWTTGREDFLRYLIEYYRKQPPIFI